MRTRSGSSARRSGGLLAGLVALGAVLWPHAVRAASYESEPGRLVLGRVESARVTFRVPEAPGEQGRPLRVSVNVGSFGPVTRQSEGVYQAVYVPPETRYPQVALVALWRETGADAPIDFVRMPLWGTTKIPVTAQAQAAARLVLGPGLTYGPVTLDAHGRGVIPIEVPPDLVEATLYVKEKGGAEVQKVMPIEVPPYNRLTVALVPHAVAATGRDPVRLMVLYDKGGVDVPASNLKLESTVGAPVFEKAEAGRYTYRYLPPAGARQKGVRFEVKVKGDPVSQAAASLELGLPAPAQVVVRPPSQRVACDGVSAAPVTLLVVDEAGLGLDGLTVALDADGQKLLAQPQGHGAWQATWVAPRACPPGGLVHFTATVRDAEGRSVSGAANYQLAAGGTPASVDARFVPSPVPADPHAEAVLELDVRDQSGVGLDGTPPLVTVSHGAVQPPVGRGGGRYVVTYAPPDGLPGVVPSVRVVDPGGALERTFEVPLRVPPGHLLAGVRGGLAAPSAASPGPRAALEVWAPLRAGGVLVGAGASVGYGALRQEVRDAALGLSSVSTATLVPLTARVGVEAYAGQRLGVWLGVGAQATWTSLHTSLNDVRTTQWALGGLGFAELTWAVGPGQVLGALSLGSAPVSTAAFHLESGGLGVEVGYRLRLF